MRAAPEDFAAALSTEPSIAVATRTTLGLPVPNCAPRAASARADGELGSAKPPLLSLLETLPP